MGQKTILKCCNKRGTNTCENVMNANRTMSNVAGEKTNGMSSYSNRVFTGSFFILDQLVTLYCLRGGEG